MIDLRKGMANRREERADIVVVGAGAAGLMAAIFAGRTARENGKTSARIIALDGAKSLGAKILVAGGGRCNVTHHAVSERDYAGSTPGAIKSVLRRFKVADTVSFFEEFGVKLKREETGKLFPTTDKARTVLNALIEACHRAGVEIRNPARVDRVERAPGGSGFIVEGAWGRIECGRVVIATGGMALPKSGSDGHGYSIVRSLGHTTTERIFPALVPLVVSDASRSLTELSGIATRATLEVRSGTNKRLHDETNDLLCTHFGLSGPGALNISRHYLDARASDPDAKLLICWLPGERFESIDRVLQELGTRTPASWLRERLPERLGRALCIGAGVDPSTPGASLLREPRRRLARAITEMEVSVERDRGFTYAEVTAGGVPLAELDLATMESKVCPGLHLVGEILDVDGRIGGFNFQWAWASGYLAGCAAGRALNVSATG